jgi:hypothetical protein
VTEIVTIFLNGGKVRDGVSVDNGGEGDVAMLKDKRSKVK